MVQWRHNLFNLVLCLKKKVVAWTGGKHTKFLKSKKVMDLVFGCKLVGKVKFDDRMLLNFAGEYSRLRCK